MHEGASLKLQTANVAKSAARNERLCFLARTVIQTLKDL